MAIFNCENKIHNVAKWDFLQRTGKGSKELEMLLFPFSAVSVQDQGKDFDVTSIGFTGCFLSSLPFHCTTGENAERNSQMFQVVGSVLEVADQAHDTKAAVK